MVDSIDIRIERPRLHRGIGIGLEFRHHAGWAEDEIDDLPFSAPNGQPTETILTLSFAWRLVVVIDWGIPDK